MDVLISVIAIVFGILNLILFFKIWSMTNDVRELKDCILSNFPKKEKEPFVKNELGDEVFSPQTKVVEIATGRQMVVKNRLPNGKYKCSYNSGTLVADMDASQLVTYEEYQEKNK